MFHLREVDRLTKVVHIAGDDNWLSNLHCEGLRACLEAGCLILVVLVVETVLVVVLGQTCEGGEQGRDGRLCSCCIYSLQENSKENSREKEL